MACVSRTCVSDHTIDWQRTWRYQLGGLWKQVGHKCLETLVWAQVGSQVAVPQGNGHEARLVVIVHLVLPHAKFIGLLSAAIAWKQ